MERPRRICPFLGCLCPVHAVASFQASFIENTLRLLGRKEITVRHGATGTRLKAKTLLHPALAPELGTYQPEFADLSSPPEDAYDQLMWEQTSKRYSRAYFGRMKKCVVSSAFCGDEIPAAPWNPSGYCVGGSKARLRRGFFDVVQCFDRRPLRVISGDSFRFWESLTCGTVSLQVDFEH